MQARSGCLFFLFFSLVMGQPAQAQPLKGKLPKPTPFSVVYKKLPTDTIRDTGERSDSVCIIKQVELAFKFSYGPVRKFNFVPSPLTVWLNDNLVGKTACKGRHCLDSLMTWQLWSVLFICEDEKGRFRLYAAHLMGSCYYLVFSGDGPPPKEIDTEKGQLDGGAYPVRLEDIRPHPESKKLRIYYAHKVSISGFYDPTKYSEILLFRSRFIKISLLE